MTDVEKLDEAVEYCDEEDRRQLRRLAKVDFKLVQGSETDLEAELNKTLT